VWLSAITGVGAEAAGDGDEDGDDDGDGDGAAWSAWAREHQVSHVSTSKVLAKIEGVGKERMSDDK
jgi:hypothetical protein